MPDCKVHFVGGGEPVEIVDVVMEEFLQKLEEKGTWWAIGDDELFIRIENVSYIEMYPKWIPDTEGCHVRCPNRSCMVEGVDCPYANGRES